MPGVRAPIKIGAGCSGTPNYAYNLRHILCFECSWELKCFLCQLDKAHRGPFETQEIYVYVYAYMYIYVYVQQVYIAATVCN
jgi:hypothetical protein